MKTVFDRYDDNYLKSLWCFLVCMGYEKSI